MTTKDSLSDLLIRYETEGLAEDEYLELYSGLVSTGWAWSLPGRFGREAAYLIESGYLDRTGEILRRPSDDY